jgi:hypothetical protein
MATMQSGKGRARWELGVSRILLAAALAGGWLPWLGEARQWDPDLAVSALDQARTLRKRLTADQSAGVDDYLRCIRLYKRVYLSDPHYQGSDDAVYEEASLYQEMAARFNAPEYDLEAVQLLRFLIREYPASQFRPYAILRLAAMGPAQAMASGPPSSVPARPETPETMPQAQPKRETVPPQSPAARQGTRAAAVRDIHYVSDAGHTRVTIDLDERATYQEQRVDNPDRVFFDFSNTWLVLDNTDNNIAVNDRLLRRIRVAQYRPGIVRVVLDLQPGTDCTVSEMSNPFRVVIDIRAGQSPVSPRD